MKKSSPYTLVFDMDGVLMDTEPIHFASEKEIFKQLNIQVGKEEHQSFVGTSTQDMWELLKKRYGLKESVEDLSAWSRESYGARLAGETQTGAIPGIPRLLEALEAEQWKLGIASSSPLSHIHQVLALTGLERYFQTLVSGDEVPKGKPHPHIYQEACRRLGVSPHKAAALEDSALGARAANAARLTVIGYQNPSSGNQNLSAAHRIIEKISELTPPVIQKLIDQKGQGQPREEIS